MQNPYDRYKAMHHEQTTQSKRPKKKGKKPVKRRIQKASSGAKNSTWLVISCVAGLLVSFYLFVYADEVLQTLSQVRIGVFSNSLAEEGENPADPNQEKGENAAALPVGQVSRLETDAKNLTMQNASVYEALRGKRLELEKKERDLARMEEDLQKQKAEIKKQLKEMQDMRREISSVLEEKVKTDEGSINKLVGVYSSMRPENAAKILTDIDEELAIKVLALMKKQSAAEILNFIEPGKARRLSEKYAGLQK